MRQNFNDAKNVHGLVLGPKSVCSSNSVILSDKSSISFSCWEELMHLWAMKSVRFDSFCGYSTCKFNNFMRLLVAPSFSMAVNRSDPTHRYAAHASTGKADRIQHFTFKVQEKQEDPFGVRFGASFSCFSISSDIAFQSTETFSVKETQSRTVIYINSVYWWAKSSQNILYLTMSDTDFWIKIMCTARLYFQ